MKRITALKSSRLQGGYLYDKGENDELCYVSRLRTTDLQVYSITLLIKCKGKFLFFIFFLKSIAFKQKMLKFHKFTVYDKKVKRYSNKKYNPATISPTAKPAIKSDG